MALKAIIKRYVPEEKQNDLTPLLQRLRMLAINQPGYISGETLKRIDRAGEWLVISSWQSSDDWSNWVLSEERKNIQEKIDSLLGNATEYEVYSN